MQYKNTDKAGHRDKDTARPRETKTKQTKRETNLRRNWPNLDSFLAAAAESPFCSLAAAEEEEDSTSSMAKL